MRPLNYLYFYEPDDVIVFINSQPNFEISSLTYDSRVDRYVLFYYKHKK